MSLYRTTLGVSIQLGSKIGGGGEGLVYDVQGRGDLVAKIYRDGMADDRREKVTAMVAAELYKRSSHIAFPIDALFDEKQRFVGFTMRKIVDARPIHELYGRADRQDKFPSADVSFLVRTAANLARAMAELHQMGCVVGDINESGLLVTDQATVVMIDSDSFQISLNGKIFPCVVGTAAYLPPELQRKRLSELSSLDQNHDNFGLAVMIFRLMMAGMHPFAGQYNGRGEQPTQPRMIEAFQYCYSKNSKNSQFSPPPMAPPITSLSPQIVNAFERAFGQQGVSGRPSGVDWIRMVDAFERQLRSCGRTKFHQYYTGLSQCPWCVVESKRGTTLFGSAQPKKAKPQAQGFTQNPYATAKQPSTQPRPAPSGLKKFAAISAVIVVGVFSLSKMIDSDSEEAAERIPPQRSQLSVKEVVVARDIENDNPFGTPTTAVRRGENQFIFFMEYEQANANRDVVTLHLWSGGRKVSQCDEFTLKWQSGNYWCGFKDFTAGSYEFRLFINGYKTRTIPFQLQDTRANVNENHTVRNFTGDWIGKTSYRGKTLNYILSIKQKGNDITGTFVGRNEDYDATLEVEGSYNHKLLRFVTTRFLDPNDAKNFCLGKFELKFIEPAWLEGHWGPYPEHKHGCPIGSRGIVKLHNPKWTGGDKPPEVIPKNVSMFFGNWALKGYKPLGSGWGEPNWDKWTLEILRINANYSYNINSNKGVWGSNARGTQLTFWSGGSDGAKNTAIIVEGKLELTDKNGNLYRYERMR